MNTHYTYFLILALSIAGPLALSFDKKVAFYRNWKYLFPSMITPAIIYIAWDVFFTHLNIWYFSEKYTTGIKIINLPIEEVLFFIIIPYCCVFVYECVRSYLPEKFAGPIWKQLLYALAFLLLVAGLLHCNLYYTGFTFIGAGTFIFAILGLKKQFQHFHAGYFLVSYVISLVPFLIVNGFLTALPVVIYNDSENMGIRIVTIPFEDIFYGMLLMLMIIADYERRKNK